MGNFNTTKLVTATATATTVENKGGLKLPSFTNSNRPGSPAAGQIIYNTQEAAAQVYTGSAWANLGGALTNLPTWNTAGQPASGQEEGDIGYNTETNSLDIYSLDIGADPVEAGWMSIPMNRDITDLLEAAIWSGITSYFTSRVSNYTHSDWYNYPLDNPPGTINDSGGDMYDGGNNISMRHNGSTTVSANMSYNDQNQDAAGGLLKWSGATYTQPLFIFGTSGMTSQNFGWESNGNLGADGGGSTSNETVHSTGTHYGCLIHSWLCNKAYNANDPSVNHFYFTMGHTSLGSSITTINTTDYSSNTDNDYSRYETTSTNCIVGRILLSRPSGNRVTGGQAETVMQAIATDFKAHMGL